METARKIALPCLLAALSAGCPKAPLTPAVAKPEPAAAKAPPTPGGKEPAARPPPPATASRDRLANADFARGVQLADGSPTAAIEAFRSAVRHDPKLYVAHYNLAVLFERLGNEGEAERHYRECLREAADYAPALTNLVHLYLRRGEPRRAYDATHDAVSRFPRRLDLRSLRARALQASGQSERAIGEAKAILREDEKNVPAMLVLAAIYYQQGKHELSAHVLRQALKIDPDNPEAHHLLGHALVALDERGKALQSFQKALDLRRDFPEALNSMAVMLLQSGDVGRALNYLEEAVQIAPGFVQAHLNLGNAYRKAGDLAKSKAAYEKVLALARSNADAIYNLALLYLDHAMPDAPDEIRRLEVALELFARYRGVRGKLPADDPAVRYVADATRKLGQLQKARARKLERERLKKLKKEMEGQKLRMGGK